MGSTEVLGYRLTVCNVKVKISYSLRRLRMSLNEWNATSPVRESGKTLTQL